MIAALIFAPGLFRARVSCPECASLVAAENRLQEKREDA